MRAKDVPSGHDVVVVNSANERLDADAASDLLLTHGLGNAKRITINTSNNGVAVGATLVTLIGV